MVANNTDNELTPDEVIEFFTLDSQMGIPLLTFQKMKDEGITEPEDLAKFTEKTLTQVVDNIRKCYHVTPSDEDSDYEDRQKKKFIFSAISHQRLWETAVLMRFYKTIGRAITASAIDYEEVTENFTEQWEALEERKKEKQADVPKISKSLPILKWTEAFDDFLNRTIGVRTIPLSYITRGNVEPNDLPDREEGKPHSVNSSVIEDLTEYASHDHPRYKDDNAKIYYFLEEATRGTEYASALKTYQKQKDGKNALSSICNQYAGQDKWLAEVKKQQNIMYNLEWKGQSNFSLEKFIGLHRNAYISMQHMSFSKSLMNIHVLDISWMHSKQQTQYYLLVLRM